MITLEYLSNSSEYLAILAALLSMPLFNKA